MIKTLLYCVVLTVLAVTFSFADDQYAAQKTTKAKGNVTLTAKLVDEAKLAKDKMAMIDVDVAGITLASDHHSMKSGAHLHYQIDNGPVIVTTEPNLSFANLTPGNHTVTVTVVDANHSPLSDPTRIEVTIP